MKYFRHAVVITILILLFLHTQSSVQASFTVMKTETLNEDQYVAIPIILMEGAVVDIKVRVISGPDIDVILIRQSDLANFRNELSYTYNQGGSDFTTQSFSGTLYLEQGNYYLILDNSDLGQAKPAWNGINDVVSVSYEYTINDNSTPIPPAIISMLVILIIVFVIIIGAILTIIYYAWKKGISAELESTAKKQNQKTKFELIESKPTGGQPSSFWYCQDCGGKNTMDNTFCGFCGSKKR